MKNIISISLIMLSFLGLSAQNTRPTIDASVVKADLIPVAPGVIQNLKAGRAGQSRVQQVVAVDYAAADAAYCTGQGGLYQEFRGYYINKNWPDYPGANRTYNWIAQYVSTIYDANNVQYNMAVSPYTLDSIDVIFSHLNNSGNQDTIRVIVYQPSTVANDRGVSKNSNDEVTNTVLWDTIINTTASISSGVGSFNLITVYPNPNLSLGATGYVIGLEYYGDTINRFDVIGGYADYCGDACLAEPSLIPNNTHLGYIVWQNDAQGNPQQFSTVINGDRPLYFDCDNSGGGSATPGGCEYFGFQNANFVSYLTFDPPLQMNAVTADAEVCPDEIIRLKANVAGGSAPYTISWTGAGIFTSPSTDNTDVVIPDTNTTLIYTVRAIDSASDTIYGSVTVTVRGVGINLGADKVIACGDSTNILTQLSGFAQGATFLWNNGNTGNILQGVKSGTYSVTVTNSAGCAASDAVTVSIPVNQNIAYSLSTVIPPDTINIGVNTTCQNKKSIFTNNSINVSSWSWVWNYGRVDQIISLNANPFTTYPNSGTFTLKISADSSGCVVEKTQTITVLPESNPACATVGIEEASWLAEAVSIYPNPNSGIFDIDLTSVVTKKSIKISVYDITGKVVFENTNVEANSIQSVDLSGVSNGFYFARVQVGDEFTTTKISVTK